jgi:hypothetical protein
MPGWAMPSFEKSPAALVERFGRVMDHHPSAERRRMFGYPCAFVGGNMATGLFADSWMVRLPEAERAELLAIDGARPFEPMAGRPMREYVVLPPSVLVDPATLDRWVVRALDYAGSLPPRR